MPLPALLGLSKVTGWIMDPKNRSLLIGIVVILLLVFIGLLFNKIGKLNSEIKYHKSETIRVENNWDASLDSIRTYQLENGDIKSEISGYKISQEELEGKYAELFDTYSAEKNKPPKTIIRTVIEYRDSIVEVPVYVGVDSLNNEYLYFKSDTTFDENNSRALEGKIYFTKQYIKIFEEDSTLLEIDDPWVRNTLVRIIPGNGNFILSQSIGLTTGLKYDEETKRPIIWAQTAYPGATITSLIGADIFDDEESRKAFNKAQKQWGLGLHLGVGYQVNKNGFTPGIYVGVGINWTPALVRW